MAADAGNIKAVRRVLKIKERDQAKFLTLIVASQKMAEQYVVLSASIKKLVKKYWPGPLTIVAPFRYIGSKKKCLLHDFAKMRFGTLALRVSSHPVAKELSRRLGRPIISTSANLSGQPTCYSIRAVKKQLAGRKFMPDFYLDTGRLSGKKLSTIVSEEDGQIVVLRQGVIKV